jgi:hypothetical protein
MRRSSKKLPEDPNQRAAAIVAISTEEPAESIKEYLSRIGKKGGLKGGKARAEKLSSARRKTIARKAAQKRWQGQKEPSTVPQ